MKTRSMTAHHSSKMAEDLRWRIKRIDRLSSVRCMPQSNDLERSIVDFIYRALYPHGGTGKTPCGFKLSKNRCVPSRSKQGSAASMQRKKRLRVANSKSGALKTG